MDPGGGHSGCHRCRILGDNAAVVGAVPAARSRLSSRRAARSDRGSRLGAGDTLISAAVTEFVSRIGAHYEFSQDSCSAKLVDQRLRLPWIGRIEALGEPAVDGGEKVTRCGAP